jgi:CubicO group peptidase (beta-lactamase class C family)
MRRDSLFRIASMTKPITAVAALILVEEGRLALDAPIGRWLPELARPRVLRTLDSPLDDTVPAARPITVGDVMSFQSGFGVVMAPPGRYPIQQAIADAGLAPGPNPPALSPDELAARYGALPLMHQPGERWMYNTGSYVLGVLIARASGQPFEAFLRERIFEPLGMADTGFSVPAAKLDRLATSYWADEQSGALKLNDGVADSKWRRPPAFPDGGAGLVSTVHDYRAFGRMLLDKGRHGRERILSRPSVELMTTDHLTPEQKAVSTFPGLWDNRGWGFGVGIVTGRDEIAAVPGRYGWDGGYGTTWASDPTEDMVAILMTQRAGFPLFSAVQRDFWTAAYQAIDD